MIYSGCPGASMFKNPTIEEKICPECGAEVEIFSIDTSVACEKCGFVVYNDIMSCINWCKYARKCIGDELYERLVAEKKIKSAEEQVNPGA